MKRSRPECSNSNTTAKKLRESNLETGETTDILKMLAAGQAKRQAKRRRVKLVAPKLNTKAAGSSVQVAIQKKANANRDARALEKVRQTREKNNVANQARRAAREKEEKRKQVVRELIAKQQLEREALILRGGFGSETEDY